MKTYYVQISVRFHSYAYEARTRASSRRVAVNRALFDFERCLRKDDEWKRLKDRPWDIIVNDIPDKVKPPVKPPVNLCAQPGCKINGDHDHGLLVDVFSVPLSKYAPERAS